MTDLITLQDNLQKEAEEMIKSTQLVALLEQLGGVIRTGSSTTGLMVYPDIDFAVQNERPDFGSALEIIPSIFTTLKARSLKVADFKSNVPSEPAYYIGFSVPYGGNYWQIDVTVGYPGAITTDPVELASWLASMTDEERLAILRLKKTLIEMNRYIGARSQPPYTFRSTHLYEGVIKGGARTITGLENYFN